MKRNLFRKEAIESVKIQNSIYGETLSDKKKINTIFFSVIFLTIFLLVILFFFEIDDTVEIDGIFDYKNNETVIKMPEDGYLSSLLVKNGSIIDVGDKIAIYHTDLANIEKYQKIKLNKENLMEILVKKKNLIEGKKYIIKNQNSILLQSEISKIISITKKIKLSSDKILNINNTIKRYKEGFYNNSISFDELNSKVIELNIEKSNYEELTSERNIATTNVASLKESFLLDSKNLETDKNSIDEEISKIRNELTSIDLMNNKFIYSNKAGKIEFIYDKSNDTFAKHELIARVVPQQNNLEAIVYIKNDALIDIKVGTKVKIKVDGIPYQKYGYLNGVIYSMTTSPHVVEKDKYYIGYIKIHKNEKYPNIFPKMNIKINIIKNRIKIYEWIIGI
ncbi:HlyD family secretion protein [Acinetobacter sp. ACZLY 512]|uniref:HlyD family efflux transporter periplasmic adaptor subunit n=1 Tax=Acinetobacter sp. ACZLY 512 TaxID=2911206 RepID=UPI0020269D94|nr:HlyD family efflux transporter periplasmic adaptor subunit [Acinetobacter sp. ACZLY 512]MCL9677222.1 HlyD family secretion protein [Acinetobacter sp. ACZLY 512]